MAHWKWRRRRRTMTDLSAVRPEPRRYVAPRWDEEFDEPWEPGHGLVIHRVRRFHRNRLVDFGVTLDIWMPSGWQHVARFDPAHGDVHLHRFRPDGTQERLVYQIIDPDRAAEMLERWFDRCRKIMDNQWWEFLKEWIDETD
jgi:hypothetical protein